MADIGYFNIGQNDRLRTQLAPGDTGKLALLAALRSVAGSDGFRDAMLIGDQMLARRAEGLKQEHSIGLLHAMLSGRKDWDQLAKDFKYASPDILSGVLSQKIEADRLAEQRSYAEGLYNTRTADERRHAAEVDERERVQAMQTKAQEREYNAKTGESQAFLSQILSTPEEQGGGMPAMLSAVNADPQTYGAAYHAGQGDFSRVEREQKTAADLARKEEYETQAANLYNLLSDPGGPRITEEAALRLGGKAGTFAVQKVRQEQMQQARLDMEERRNANQEASNAAFMSALLGTIGQPQAPGTPAQGAPPAAPGAPPPVPRGTPAPTHTQRAVEQIQKQGKVLGPGAARILELGRQMDKDEARAAKDLGYTPQQMERALDSISAAVNAKLSKGSITEIVKVMKKKPELGAPVLEILRRIWATGGEAVAKDIMEALSYSGVSLPVPPR